MLTRTLLLIAFITCFCSQVFATVVYTWVDEEGTAHYSQQPPEGIQATKLYSEDMEQAPIGFISPPIKQAEPELTQAEKDALTIKLQDEEQATSLCKSAKHNLSLLRSYERLTRKDTDTDAQVVMTPDEKQEAIEQQKERIRLFCEQ